MTSRRYEIRQADHLLHPNRDLSIACSKMSSGLTSFRMEILGGTLSILITIICIVKSLIDCNKKTYDLFLMTAREKR
jgi:hypothetical protein